MPAVLKMTCSILESFSRDVKFHHASKCSASKLLQSCICWACIWTTKHWNTDKESFHHHCEPFSFQTLVSITHGMPFTCVRVHSGGTGSLILDTLCFPIWLSEAWNGIKNSKIYLFIVDSLAYSCPGDSNRWMSEWGRLPSRWLSVFRVPILLSSISASLSASSPLFWFKPWPVVIWFILVPQEIK